MRITFKEYADGTADAFDESNLRLSVTPFKSLVDAKLFALKLIADNDHAKHFGGRLNLGGSWKRRK